MSQRRPGADLLLLDPRLRRLHPGRRARRRAAVLALHRSLARKRAAARSS